MADAKTPLLGLTIPAADGSDGAGEWPRISGQGLIDLENTLILGLDSRTASSAYSSYPLGFSMLGLSLNGAQNGGWPGAQGVVLSMRRADGTITYQLKIDSSGDVRTRFGNSSSWSSWTVVGSPSLPSAMATGQVTINGGSGVRQAVVMLPRDRFTSTPRIAVWNNNSSRPDVQTGCSMSDASATQFTAYVNRLDDLGASVGWSAIQGVE